MAMPIIGWKSVPKGFPPSSVSKESACNAGDMGSIPGSAEREMATHSSIAWRIPWTEEPSGVQSTELQESDTTEWLSLPLLPQVKLDHKEDWAPKNWCFQTVVLEKTLESSPGQPGDQTSQP